MKEIDELTKLTVNLVPDAVLALKRVAETTGDTMTDTVNRALLLFGQLVDAEPGQRFVFDVAPGVRRRLRVDHPGEHSQDPGRVGAGTPPLATPGRGSRSGRRRWGLRRHLRRPFS